MGKKKSNYEKLVESAYTYSDMEYALTLADILESWMRLRDYIEGAPWRLMSAEGAARLRDFVEEWTEKVLSAKADRVVEEYLREVVERRPEELYPHFRPAYVDVLRFLIERPQFIEAVEERPHEAYRRIAEELGISWRTVRDAVWHIRRAGFWE